MRPQNGPARRPERVGGVDRCRRHSPTPPPPPPLCGSSSRGVGVRVVPSRQQRCTISSSHQTHCLPAREPVSGSASEVEAGDAAGRGRATLARAPSGVRIDPRRGVAARARRAPVDDVASADSVSGGGNVGRRSRPRPIAEGGNTGPGKRSATNRPAFSARRPTEAGVRTAARHKFRAMRTGRQVEAPRRGRGPGWPATTEVSAPRWSCPCDQRQPTHQKPERLAHEASLGGAPSTQGARSFIGDDRSPPAPMGRGRAETRTNQRRTRWSPPTHPIIPSMLENTARIAGA